MINRRTFLKHASLTTAGLLWAERILADSNRAISLERVTYRPIRIRGKVNLEGRGVAGVGVSGA